MKVLVVTNPFGGREAGETIRDPREIELILAGEHAQHVVRADHPDEPKPKSSKEA
jgi:hypothetical protein